MFARLTLLSAPDAEGNRRVWINVARAGEWKGHPRGPFEFTAEVFDQIIANAERRKTPINCDYEHQTFKPSVSGAVPSSGHIVKLERRDDTLWALVELTARAAQHVRDGEYRSCSPVIEFDAKDRASGEDVGPEMLSLALTNDPFQDGLVPYRLTRSVSMSVELTDEEKKKASAAAHVTAAEKKPEEPAEMSATPAAPAAVTLADDKPAEKTEEEKKKEEAVQMADPVAEADAAAAAAAEGAADGDVDADAVFEAIADAAGKGKAEVLEYIADNIDAFVGMIQDGLAKGDAGKATPMSRTVDQSANIRALSIELKQRDEQVKALTARMVAAENQLKADRDRAEADKSASIKAHVLSLQKTGHVGPTDQHVDDAIWLFTQDRARAERAYSTKLVPVGAPDTEDERNPKATTNTVTLDNLSERELNTVNFLVRTGIAQDDALKTVGAQRAGKGN